MKPETLKTLIDEGTLQEAQDRAQERFPVSPSQIGACPRALALRLSGAPESPLSAQTQRVFDLGHQRGASLAQALRRRLEGMGYTVRTEMDLSIPLEIDRADEIADKADEVQAWNGLVSAQFRTLFLPGACDLFAYLPMGMDRMEPILIDFKTAGGYSFGLVKGGQPPSPRYVAQLFAYRNGLSEWVSPEDVSMYLVYECKDSDARKGLVAGDLHVVPVEDTELNRSIYAQAQDGARQALTAWLDGKASLVPEPYALKGRSLPWECNYCPVGPVNGACYGPVENTGTPLRPKYRLHQEALS